MKEKRRKIEGNVPTYSISQCKLENEPNAANLKVKRKETSELNLPREILCEIFLKLPPNSIVRLKRVCKLFSEITSDQSFVSSYENPNPLILFELCEGMCLINGIGVSKRKLVADIRKMPFAKQDETAHNHGKYRCINLFMHCEGMICYMTTSGTKCEYTVGNPVTQEWITVKSPSTGTPILQCVYYHPSSGEYRMLWGSKYYDRNNQEHSVISLGTNNWRQIDNSPFKATLIPPSDYVRQQTSPLLLNGKMHMFTPWMDIIVFDIESEKFSEIKHPLLASNSNPKMVEIEGKFCLLEITGKSAPFAVKVWMLEDYSSGLWHKEEVLVRDARTSEMEDAMPLTLYRNRILFVKYFANEDGGGTKKVQMKEKKKWGLHLLTVGRLTNENVVGGLIYKFRKRLATFKRG